MLSPNNYSSPSEAESTNMGFLNYLDSIYNSKTFLIIQIIIALYCLVLIFDIIYASTKLSLFKGKTRQFLTGTKAKVESYKAFEAMSGTMKILELNKKLASDSASDWKIAIIEADKALSKLLEKKNFFGNSLGDKLKQMVPADLPEVYDEVWEAHKIRNQIVHEPDFEVTQSEARKIVGIYERAIKNLS